MKPKKPRKRLGRKIGDAIQDVKKNIQANKGARKIKRTLKDSSEKVNKEVVDKRAVRRSRLKRTEKETKWGKTRVSKDDRGEMKGSGVSSKKVGAIRQTGSAKRASRTLGRMDKQDKRRLERKVK